MSNLLRIADYREPQIAAQEQRVADLEDGYTRLATSMLEAIAGADLTKRQFKVLLAVIRLTYGWNKVADQISNSQLAEITGLPIKRVSETRVQLIKMRVLIMTGNQIGPNKNLSEWVFDGEEESLKTGDNESPKTGDSESLKIGDLNPPKRGIKHPLKQGDTINNININNKTLSSSRNPDGLHDAPIKKFLSAHPEAAGGIYTPSGKSWGTADDLTAAQWIYDLVLAVNATAKTPNWPEWANTIRLLRQQDGRTHHEICKLFRWANRDTFWCANVQSPTALRKHWDRLMLQSRQPARQTPKSQIDFHNTDWADGLTI